MKLQSIGVGAALFLLAGLAPLFSAVFSWQEDQARVLPSGELEYTPRPFVFEAGASQRYIDFESGSDSSKGSKGSPWKHHPWDPDATGNAKSAAQEVHTYIFKGGVDYRGRFVVPAGAKGNEELPIRLTRDPSWGDGPAVLNGAEEVSGWTRKAHSKMPDGKKVWSAEVDFLPRTLWLTSAGKEPVRLQLARWPNWTETNERDLMSEWPTWDQPEWWKDKNVTQIGKNSKHIGIAETLPQPLEDLVGGTVWSEWGIVMGSPYPASIEGVAEVTQGNKTYQGIAFRGPWTYNALEKIITGNRYYLEDLPQLLDEPGEFWVEKLDENRSRIYVRLPEDENPNDHTLEAGRHYNLFEGSHFEHIHWAGLTFRFGNMGWDYNHPQWGKPNLLIGAIRLSGSGDGIVIANNTFEYLPMPIRMDVGSSQQAIGTIAVQDNLICNTDHGAITIQNASGRGENTQGSLGHVDILRNRLEQIGMRIVSGEHGHAVDIRFPATSHVAGNFLHRVAGWGLAVWGGKPSGAAKAGLEIPLSRHLIHHNRVEDVLLKSNDWGGIETWQGGSHYIFNNIVINALGFKHWIYNQGKKDRASSFGHAYYMDGSFKNYMFNNIGLGQNNDVSTPSVNLTAIQNIFSFENWYFNNSFHRFVAATRQQAPDAGRFRYLGNAFSDVSQMLFRHANPQDAEPDPNAAHYTQGGSFDYATIAYADNVLFDISGNIGTFEETGVVYDDKEGFASALAKVKAQADQLGTLSNSELLNDPDGMDWRPASGSGLQEQNVLVFVPWGLAMTVGEWNFTQNKNNPNEIIDEHWFMTANYADRKLYKDTQRFPLLGTAFSGNDYVASPYENWTAGALRLDGSRSLRIAHDTLPKTEATDDPNDVTVTTLEFGKVTSPVEISMGAELITEIELNEGIDPSHLQLHMHWLKATGFGGFSGLGGKPEHLGGRRYRFTIRTNPINDAKTFSLIFFLSPDGNWNNKSANASVKVPIGTGIIVADATPRSVDVADTSLIVEAIVNPLGDGLIAGKQDGSTGYALELQNGTPVFSIMAASNKKTAEGLKINEGEWNHILAEFDRAEGTLNVYVNGKVGKAIAVDANFGSLANQQDFIVGEGLQGDLDFLRVALTSLRESKTSIEELYNWQMNGPQYFDFAGNDRRQQNAAGALVQ